MNFVEPIRSLEDIEKIKNLLKNRKRDYLLFCFGINTGLRISDILSLNVVDVLNKNYVTIIEKKTKKRKKIVLNTTLKILIKNFLLDKNNDAALFKTRFNNRLDRVQAYRIIKNVCNKVNCNLIVGTHTLRKTFAYHHYKQFKDVALLQKILNHSSPSITLNYIGIAQEEIDYSYLSFNL